MKSLKSKVNVRTKDNVISEAMIRKRDRAATETAILLAAIQVFAKKATMEPTLKT